MWDDSHHETGPPISIIIKKILYKPATVQSYGGIFLNQGSFFSDNSSLHQFETKLARTVI